MMCKILTPQTGHAYRATHRDAIQHAKDVGIRKIVFHFTVGKQSAATICKGSRG